MSATEATQGGSSLTQIQFVSGAGDDLGDVMAEWLNDNIKKGKIVTG